MSRCLLIAISMLSLPSHAGNIADTFGEGVFGLHWGASRSEIVAKFPEGKWSARPAGDATYTIVNSKPVLGIARPSQQIRFNLDASGRLTIVHVVFARDAAFNVALRAHKAFGPSEVGIDTDFLADNSTSRFMRWSDDGGVVLLLLLINLQELEAFPPSTYLIINGEGARGARSKEALGFQ